MVRIGLFGGVSAVTDGGEPVDVGPAKCQTVLAVLALSAGSAVPVTRLVELVWGDEPPRTAEKTLQSYVVRLRAGLGADVDRSDRAAYRLAVPADAVDVARFRRQLDLGDIEAALGEWTGTPLAGLDAQSLIPMVDGLVEQWLGAVETDLARRVETDPPGGHRPVDGTHRGLSVPGGVVGTADDRAVPGGAAGRCARGVPARPPSPRGAARGGTRPTAEGSGVADPGPRRAAPRRRGRRSSPSARPTGTVTFGFCEVEDAARLWATNRKKTAAAMARLDELVRAAVNRQGGFLFVIGGESFGAAFHRADDAAAWATELQLGVSSEPWPGGVELRLRIGLHTGETEDAANGYFGAAVNEAQRLRQRRARRPNPCVRGHCRVAGPQRPA